MGSDFKMENVSGILVGVGNRAEGTIKIKQVSNPQLAEIECRLQELTSLLTQHANEIVDQAQVQDAIMKAEKEVRSDQPRPGKLRKWLSAVSDAAPGVTAIARTVKEITDLLPGM